MSIALKLDPPLAFTVKECERATGLSHTTVYTEIREGRLPSIFVGGRRLVLRKDLEAYLESGRGK
jgi:excisionase family DNA binding protein